MVVSEHPEAYKQLFLRIKSDSTAKYHRKCQITSISIL